MINYFQNVVFDLSYIQEYWIFTIGIISLTSIAVLFLEFEKMMVTFGLTVFTSFALKIFDNVTIPNIFCVYFLMIGLSTLNNIYNHIKIMGMEMEKLSKLIEGYGRESMYLDIVYSQDRIDAEYFISYYKIRITETERKKYTNDMDRIIIPENIKLCGKEEIISRINNLVAYIKSQNLIVINSINMNGFKPSNSLIKFYIKMILMKRSIETNNSGVYDKFNGLVTRILSKFGNNFKSYELINIFNFTPVPQYKIDDENFKIVLNKTIDGIEKYFDVYSRNNFYFF